MANLINDAVTELNEIIKKALGSLIAQGKLPNEPIPAFSVEIPADKAHGDFATNVAMTSARVYKSNPRAIAQSIIDNAILDGTYFSKCEVAGPGFINFFLNDSWFSHVVSAVINEQELYGRSNFGGGKKVMVEFVSANPTGPMHMGNARGGALGDCLASALDYAGFNVTREFYVNDAGNQIGKFGKSLEARYLQLYKGEAAVEFPEDGYHGEDIAELAKEFSQINGDTYINADSEERKKALIDFALPKNVAKLESDLAKYRIHYDIWFRESALHESGKVETVMALLKNKGLTYEKDDALWYKATEFGAEKDEVLVRGNGNPTYFASDIAYHYNKFAERGFDKVINVWGADHHGHVARLKGAMDAVGLDGSKLDIVLMQLVRLTKDGEVVRMSKRTGKAITLSDLLEEVPIDAARFFFNLREPNSQMEFDLGLAVEESSQNPVYYVQYAHARTCSIIKNLKAEGCELKALSEQDLTLLKAPEELEIIRHLAALPKEIIEAAKNYDPARITRYSIELATLFHKFYSACHVKGEVPQLMQARLALCLAVKTVIKNVLTLLKIESPESM